MAKKTSQTSSSTTTTTTKKSEPSFSSIINVLAYIAVCVGGLALFISMILSKVGVSAGFVSALQAIANAIGWAVLCLLSFKYIRRRRKIWMWVVWAIAVVMIITGIVIAAI
jgi:hypothetical protein